MEMLPDSRRKKVLGNMLLGILGGQTPVITGMARQNGKADGETWAIAKSIYRLLGNKRLETKVIYQGLYQVGLPVFEFALSELQMCLEITSTPLLFLLHTQH